jgi:hypothetical protein
MIVKKPEPDVRKTQETGSIFEGIPHVTAFISLMDAAMEKFKSALQHGCERSEGERLCHFWSCLVALIREFEAAKRAALGSASQDTQSLLEKFAARFDERIPRQLSLGEERAIRVAVAYEDGFRPSFVGAKDTPMEAALQVAAYLEGLPLDTGPTAIQKSIQRFRKSIAGQEMFEFDKNTFEWRVHRAEDVMLRGLPRHRGRPKSAMRPQAGHVS